jgi:hypothetical protein
VLSNGFLRNTNAKTGTLCDSWTFELRRILVTVNSFNKLPMSRSYSVTADLTSQKVNGHRKNSLQQPTGHTFPGKPGARSRSHELKSVAKNQQVPQTFTEIFQQFPGQYSNTSLTKWQIE